VHVHVINYNITKADYQDEFHFGILPDSPMAQQQHCWWSHRQYICSCCLVSASPSLSRDVAYTLDSELLLPRHCTSMHSTHASSSLLRRHSRISPINQSRLRPAIPGGRHSGLGLGTPGMADPRNGGPKSQSQVKLKPGLACTVESKELSFSRANLISTLYTCLSVKQFIGIQCFLIIKRCLNTSYWNKKSLTICLQHVKGSGMIKTGNGMPFCHFLSRSIISLSINKQGPLLQALQDSLE